MKRILAIVFSLVALGCVDTLQDAAHPPGQMDPSGTIYPCHGWESDKQLCGNAKFFSGVLKNVAIGQTQEQVRSIMKRDPWRREASGEESLVIEKWGYPTSYEDERMVWLTFRNGKLVNIDETAWQTDKD
jgi:hypothetical protein